MNSKSDMKRINKSGLFDAEYYLNTNPDVHAAHVDPLNHFIKHGWKERRNPSSQFDINFYLQTYPDVTATRINPLVHYIKYGKKEGRKMNPSDTVEMHPKNMSKIKKLLSIAKYVKKNPNLIKKFYKEIRQNGFSSAFYKSANFISKTQHVFQPKAADPIEYTNLPFVANGFIFISHDDTATGAPILLYNLCKSFRHMYGERFVILLLENVGEMVEDFRQLGPTFVFNAEQSNEFFNNLYEHGYRKSIANTVLSGQLSDTLKRHEIKTLYLVHELPQLIQNSGYEAYARSIAQSGSPVIFGSRFVADRFISHYPIHAEDIHIISQGIQDELIYHGDKTSAKQHFFSTFGIPFDPSVKIALGAGYAHHRKGTDLFCKTAEYCYKQFPADPFLFVWMGDRDPYFQSWQNDVLPTLPYRDKIIFIDFQKEADYIFAAADVFILSSREDPYPGVALCAFANHVPVVMFEGTGGISELIDEQNGRVVPAFDCFKMAQGIMELTRSDAQWHMPVGDYPGYLKQLMPLMGDSIALPSISVVIPNYNYAHFLTERLKSILDQTVRVDEVIFLDDCSSDESLAVAKRILESYNIPYKIIENECNVGVYRQWIRGFETTRNNLVWIAEADDVADPLFLEHLLPYFLLPEVAMAYSQSSLIDENNLTVGHASSHTDLISMDKWSRHYIENGKDEIRDALVYRNTIPNVSACIIDKRFLDETVLASLLSYRYTGDWFLYTSLLLKGKIGFCAKILNHFRKHGQNVTTTNQHKDKYLLELLDIKENIYRSLPISRTIHAKAMKIFEQDFLANHVLFSPIVVEKMEYLATLIKKEIVFVTFNTEFGGSEVLWFEMAQYLAAKNCSISILSYSHLMTDQQQRKLKLLGVKLNTYNTLSPSDLIPLSPDLVVFSIGDHNDGGEWFELCHQQRIDYLIVNQLVKEDMWISDPTALNKIFEGYENAKATFFTCLNNQKIFERKMKETLNNALIHFNPMSIDRDDCVPYPPADDRFHLAFPARLLTVHKGQDILLHVLADSKWKKREIVINFYGEGPDTDMLHALVSKLKLTNAIFHGYVSNVRTIWETNHAFILTSHMEGIPIVLLGAMFAGRVPIVTNVGGNTEVVQDNVTGFIAQFPTKKSVDEALERAWAKRNEWEQMGQLARENILRQYPKNPLEDFYQKMKKAVGW